MRIGEKMLKENFKSEFMDVNREKYEIDKRMLEEKMNNLEKSN